MAVVVGIIAEDESDVEVIKVLMQKISTKRFQLKSLVGGGCGQVVSKCRAWSGVLKARGCTLLLVVHDLDERRVNELRSALQLAVRPCAISKHIIVIPVRELEAWLLADHSAINATFHLKRKISKITSPETVPRPKEQLRDMLYSHSNHKVIYVTTVHNGRIAANVSVDVLRRRCSSFLPLYDFVDKHLVA